MQPESSGCNEVKYNLNVDTIEAIFKTYPAGEEIFSSLCVRQHTCLVYDYFHALWFNLYNYSHFSSVKRKHQEVVPHEV